MTPEAERILKRAEKHLERGQVMLRAGLNDAGRAAYWGLHVAPDQRIFLSKAYNLKAIADYETGPGAELSAEEATVALNRARGFVDTVRSVLTPA